MLDLKKKFERRVSQVFFCWALLLLLETKTLVAGMNVCPMDFPHEIDYNKTKYIHTKKASRATAAQSPRGGARWLARRRSASRWTLVNF